MKTKTIRKILKSKIEDWCKSVTDAEVVKAIKQHSIVTGGSIASMLLKENVNDYDIYFDDRNALLKVVKYYLPENERDVVLLDGYEKSVANLKSIEGYETQYSIAIENMEEDQVKLYISGDVGVHVKEYRDEYKEKHKYLPVCYSPNAISLTDDIQVVIRFFGDAKEIHKNYDFVHATNYYMYTKDKLTLRQEALEALLTKELRYIGSKYPVTSIIRSKKFINRGFTITAGEYLKILFQISELDLKDIAVLHEQLIGVDVAYFNQLIIALSSKEKKDNKFKITYPYISKLIDNIFN